MTPQTATPPRFRPLNRATIRKTAFWEGLPAEVQEAVDVVSAVLPFRTNAYVVKRLIDWDRVPHDPIFQLTFPQRDMLAPADYRRIRDLLHRDAPRAELDAAVYDVRMGMNPHPAGQLTANVPTLDGRPLPGLQHKYRETVLFFPSQGQTCHAYCTYCFRWAQFVNLPELKFENREVGDLTAYLQRHPEVSDVLFTGGDPMIMKASVLAQYIEPLLLEELPGLRSIRIGTKALAWWPQRFLTDPDADDLMRLFERVVASGKQLAVMAHVSHPAELRTRVARRAIRRLRSVGAQLRMQAPLVRHVNDDAGAWARMWTEGVRLGMVPYYMFVERDTGPRGYFEVPLLKAQRIFRDAYSQVSGLARTVRGPSMSATPGKVRVAGVTRVNGKECFALEFLQARNPDWVLRPFFAHLDPAATWLDDLKPADGTDRFFFEDEVAVAC